MSAVSSAIAELERRRTEIDDAIVVLRRIDGAGIEPAAPVVYEIRTAKPAAKNGKKGKRPVGSPRGGRKVDTEQAARVRELYEQGAAIGEIEKQTKVKKATIYYRASAGKWKRPKVAAPAGDALPGKVRCPHCELWTEHDPCSNCGKKVRR